VPEIYIPNVDASKLTCYVELRNQTKNQAIPITEPILFELDFLEDTDILKIDFESSGSSVGSLSLEIRE
jgi:hypothetical protein